MERIRILYSNTFVGLTPFSLFHKPYIVIMMPKLCRKIPFKGEGVKKIG